MKLMTAICVTAACVSFPGLARASAPGGSDMCGIGWEVTSKKSFLGTSTRTTTHAFIPPTFGMTSGTSGCDRHTVVKSEENAARFIASNEDAIRIELVQGGGEYVEALTETLGCRGDAARRLAPALRADYKPGHETDAVKVSTGLDLFLRIRASLQADPILSQGCTAIASSSQDGT